MAFSAGSGNGGDEMPQMAEINIVPLVDVMLVLLIISMVTMPFLEQGVNVELPRAAGQALKQAPTETPVVLYVSRDQNLRIGDKPVTRADLGDRLVQIFSKRQGKEILVRADKDVPYGVVAQVIAEVKSSGIEHLGLVTQPSE